ncbi:MAG: hypothetical protein KJ831_08570 [Candidatus Eisenbacteria bacterium]|nr:hypothetical protein [Candidatus Eisenbacteria bacterium]
MTNFLKKMTPTVGKRTLILLSGVFWIAAGGILLSFAWRWLSEEQGKEAMFTAGAGLLAALIIHHFGFLKVVDKNLGRIKSMQNRKCAFAFQSWRSYFVIVIMMALGFALRHSPLPKLYVSALYIAIGSALLLSSVRYLRVGLKGPT